MTIMIETEIKPQFGEVYKCAFYLETVGSEVKGHRSVSVVIFALCNAKKITFFS